MAAEPYDRIGKGYAQMRRPDPRLAALIDKALGDATTVLNVGAGAGSYEPTDRFVVAVEPSAVMLAQHPGTRRVQAVAYAFPFPDHSFDAAMAVMTVHHWPDLDTGLSELRRVARRQVVFTWDPDWHRVLWVVEEYVPEIHTMERTRFTALDHVVEVLNAHTPCWLFRSRGNPPTGINPRSGGAPRRTSIRSSVPPAPRSRRCRLTRSRATAGGHFDNEVVTSNWPPHSRSDHPRRSASPTTRA